MEHPPTYPSALTTAEDRPTWATVIGILSIIVAGFTFLSAVFAPLQIWSMRMNRAMMSSGAFQPKVTVTYQGPPASGSINANANANAAPSEEPAEQSADAVESKAASTPRGGGARPPPNLPNFQKMFDYPAWVEWALGVRAVVDLLLAAVLLTGGIQLLRSRPSYRPAHLLYSFLALLTLVAWGVTCVQSGSIMVMNSAICTAVLTLPYPIVVLVFMFNEQGMRWYEIVKSEA